jgi:hypothetical protein
MASITDRLKGLFGAKKTPAKKMPPAKHYVVSKTNRAEVMAEAMAVYRREKGRMQDGLDKALADMRKEAPKLLHDPEALARLLTLHRAHVDMRKMMTSDHKRFLVLSGMRELLGEDKPAKPAKKPSPKR